MALNWAGVNAFRDGDVALGRKLLEESVAVARQVGESRPLTNAMRHLAVSVHMEDPAAARVLLEEALVTARGAEETREVAYALSYLGKTIDDAGDLVAAQRLYAGELTAGRQSGDA